MHTNEPSGTGNRTKFLQMLMETLDEQGDYWRHSRLCDEPEVEHFLLVLEDAYHELAQYLEFLDASEGAGEAQ